MNESVQIFHLLFCSFISAQHTMPKHTKKKNRKSHFGDANSYHSNLTSYHTTTVIENWTAVFRGSKQRRIQSKINKEAQCGKFECVEQYYRLNRRSLAGMTQPVRFSEELPAWQGYPHTSSKGHDRRVDLHSDMQTLWHAAMHVHKAWDLWLLYQYYQGGLALPTTLTGRKQ